MSNYKHEQVLFKIKTLPYYLYYVQLLFNCNIMKPA